MNSTKQQLIKSKEAKSKKTIVAADDQAGQRMLLDVVLSVEYDLVLLEDGLEVLEYLKNNTAPDLIILDVEMPKINGLDICSRIKQVGRLKETPVLIVTGDERYETKLLAKLSKADRLIYKPLSGKDFSSIVSNLLNKVPQA